MLIALHSLVDLDLQFGALAFLFAFLASGPDAPTVALKKALAGVVCGLLGFCLCALGDYEGVAGFCAEEGIASDAQALYASLALRQLGEEEEALLLIEELERQSYSVGFYRSAKTVLDFFSLDDELKGRYNAAVERANELAAETSQALSPQTLDTFL